MGVIALVKTFKSADLKKILTRIISVAKFISTMDYFS